LKNDALSERAKNFFARIIMPARLSGARMFFAYLLIKTDIQKKLLDRMTEYSKKITLETMHQSI
jgi:hypothetical protein